MKTFRPTFQQTSHHLFPPFLSLQKALNVETLNVEPANNLPVEVITLVIKPNNTIQFQTSFLVTPLMPSTY